MAKENSAGLGVYNNYGPRQTDEGRAGQINTAGVVKELQINFRGSDFDSNGVALLDTATLPAGSKFIEAYASVQEAFVLGGTTPTINVGTSGSAGTNYGIELSEAQAESAATAIYNDTGAGTWASVLAAATTVAVELDGTSPTVTDAGEATIVIRYIADPDV